MLQKLKGKYLTLKPDKNQSIISMNRNGYNDSLKKLFNNTSRFRLVDHDLTLQNISSIHRNHFRRKKLCETRLG